MFKLAPWSRKSVQAPPRAPEGKRVYAVGDIHGRADLLDDLLARIETDANGAPSILVFLGDYIDRGADSRGVINRLIALSERGHELVFLRGNHEAAMLNFLRNPETGLHWVKIGGGETMRSYGVGPPLREAEPAAFEAAALALREAVPDTHIKFLNSLTLTARYGDYVFVHAGLRPGRDLGQQEAEDLLEIRAPFLKSSARWPFVVVHGHSPVERGYRDERRIAIDTGAYATGRLSAVRLDGEAVDFIATG